MADVNVLVSAHRTDAPQHEIARGWLEDAINGSEALGLTDAVSAGYVRIVTHPRVFADPTPLEYALDHMARLREAAGVLRVTPGRAHWDVFTRLCREADARGNLVSDAVHAATAVEAGATWVTFDRDFARFPGLQWRVPESARS